MLLFLLRMDKRLRLQVLTLFLIGADIFSNVEGGRCYSCKTLEQCFYPNNTLAKKEDCDSDYCFKLISYFDSTPNYKKGCAPKNLTLRMECIIENFSDKEGCFYTRTRAQDEIIIPCIKRKLASLNKTSEGEDGKINYIKADLCYCKGDFCNDGGIPGKIIPKVKTTLPPPPPKVYGQVECYECGKNSSVGCKENAATEITLCKGTYCFRTYQGSTTGWDSDENKPDDSRPRRGCFTTAALECLQERNPDRCYNLSPDDFEAIGYCEAKKSKESYVDGQELSFNLSESKLSDCICQNFYCNTQEIKPVRRCHKCEVETNDEKQVYFKECHGDKDHQEKNLVECSTKYCFKRTIFEGSPATWFSEKSKKLRIQFGCLNGSYEDEERAFQCTEKNKNDTKGHPYGCRAFEDVQECVGNGKRKWVKPTKECICDKDRCNNRGGKLNGGELGLGLITFLICFGWISLMSLK